MKIIGAFNHIGGDPIGEMRYFAHCVRSCSGRCDLFAATRQQVVDGTRSRRQWVRARGCAGTCTRTRACAGGAGFAGRRLDCAFLRKADVIVVQQPAGLFLGLEDMDVRSDGEKRAMDE